ncbi:MAG TPA: hypothetical protein VFW77_01730 [Candidatus Saccharimonadales bacterium]|nr:hypothetical protein [Candidatus Saccharimonadales bacterium]
MIDERFIILAVLIDFIGSGGYILDTLKGSTKPNRVTWFLWTLIPAVALAGMIQEGASKTALILAFVFGFIPLLVFIASFINKKSFWKITKFDWICAALSIIGIAAWLVTNDGNLAIIFSIITDTLATLPTLVKGFKAPETESWLVYLNAATASAITLLTLKNWDFASAAFTIYLLVACLILFITIRFQIGKRLVALKINRV